LLQISVAAAVVSPKDGVFKAIMGDWFGDRGLLSALAMPVFL